MSASMPAADFRRAEQALLQAVGANPGDADAAHRLAQFYQGNGRAADAVPHYENVVRLRPQDADALYHLGLALADLGRPDDALDCYQRAAAIRPDHAPAQCNLGVALAQRGQLAEAEEHLRPAVAADPNSAQAHHNLGVALAQQGFAQQEKGTAYFIRRPQTRPNKYAVPFSCSGLDKATNEAGKATRRGLSNDEFHAELFARIIRNYKSGDFEFLTPEDIKAFQEAIKELSPRR